MALRKARPVVWTPSGVSDCSDGGNVFKGAMTALQDLVPDPSTKGIYVPRPAAVQLTDFSGSGISNPGFISALKIVGDTAYGFVSTTSPGGKDVPFIYNIATGTFTSISGITSGNTPDSVATTGTWTPPTIAVIGTKVIFTHPNFTAGSPFGVLDISGAPTWTATNTSPNALPGVPTAVENFASRAYFAVDNFLYFSDNLAPDTITNATQSLTIGDESPVIGLGKIPLSSVTAGSVEALMAFKEATINQITGDVALNTLLNSEVATGIGTRSPLSITPTPYGLMFVSQFGLRNISIGGEMSGIVGADGGGVSVPFINAVEPSRIAAGFNVHTYRVNVQNSNIPTLPYQDWWYNSDLKSWTGPHTFPASLIDKYKGSFIMTPQGINAELWQSDIVPNDASSYIENGNQIEFLYQTALMPDGPTMNEWCVIESTLGLQFSKVGGTVNFFCQDEDGVLLNSASKTIDVTASVWGTTSWGTSQWGGDVTNYQQIQIPWSDPLVFSQASFGATGNAVSGLKIGAISNRFQQLGWMRQR